MRADVKLGMVLAFVAVVAGWGYFHFQSREASVPVGEQRQVASESEMAEPQPEATPARPVRSGPQSVASRRPATTPARAPRTTSPMSPERKSTPVRSGSDTPREQARPAAAGPERPGRTPGTPAERTESQPETTKVAEANTPPAPGATQPPAPDSRPGATRLAGQNPTPRRTLPVVTGPTREPDSSSSRRPSGPSAVDLHKVQAGDTFSALAVIYFGSERYTQFLIDANPQIADPNRLSVGTEIRIPEPPAETTPRGTRPAPAARSAQTTPQPPASPRTRTYTVKEGDTFYGIARDVLGSAGRWEELFELNKELVKGNPKNLQIGQVLTLPPERKASSD